LEKGNLFKAAMNKTFVDFENTEVIQALHDTYWQIKLARGEGSSTLRVIKDYIAKVPADLYK